MYDRSHPHFGSCRAVHRIRIPGIWATLARVLCPSLQGGIHHVGSAAVPGVAAKPIPDMIVGVLDLAAAAPAITALRRLSYGHARTGRMRCGSISQRRRARTSTHVSCI